MPCETLAAVVSRQHVPIILSVLHFAPRRLLLLVTQEMRREGQLETLLSSLALAGSPFPEECTTLVFLDEDKSSFEACRRLNDAFVKAGSIDVVNITSGTKPLAGALLAAAITKQVRDVIYVDADFPEAFVDQRTGKSRRFDKPIMMDVFLAAHRARSYKTLVPEEDKRKIATMFAGSDIRSFRNARAKTTDTNAEVLLAPAGQPPYDASVRKLLVDAICSLPPEERYEFVTFRWLEVFMFVLLQRCAERLGIYGLNMNLKLRWTDRPHLTNELDIAFMRNNAFWYVECKSGEFFRRTNDIDGRKKNASEDPANVLYPIAGKISQFQSIGARSIAVLTQRSDEPEDTERRAHQMGLRLIDRSNFDRLTAAYLDNREDVLAFELKKAFGWHQ